MTYHKMTTIYAEKPGYNAENKPVGQWSYEDIEKNRQYKLITTRSGHWKPESALNLARRAGCVGPVEVTYSTGDLSGKGYGGYDKKFSVDETGVTPLDLDPWQKDYDDAEDINGLWDEMEDAR